MNPFVKEIVISLIRQALYAVSGFLVAQGIWTDQDVAKYVPAIVLFISTTGWNWYEKWRHRQTLNTALASSTPMSEKQASAMVKDRDVNTPPASVPSNRIPYIGEKPKDAYETPKE